MEERKIHYYYYPGGVSVVIVEGTEIYEVAFLTTTEGPLASRWGKYAFLLTKEEVEQIRKTATLTVMKWFRWSLDMNHQLTEELALELFEKYWNKSYRCVLPEPKLWRIIIDVQFSPTIDECNKLYDGSGYGTIFTDCNGEAVIDYLKQWDYPEYNMDCLRMEEPRWVGDGSDSVYEKDGYKLAYSSKLGGVYMLYREATKDEINDFINQ